METKQKIGKIDSWSIKGKNRLVFESEGKKYNCWDEIKDKALGILLNAGDEQFKWNYYEKTTELTKEDGTTVKVTFNNVTKFEIAKPEETAQTKAVEEQKTCDRCEVSDMVKMAALKAAVSMCDILERLKAIKTKKELETTFDSLFDEYVKKLNNKLSN